MAVASIKAVFYCNKKRAWDVVTSLTDYSWRSDISRIEVVSDHQFIEHSKEGVATTFTITNTIPYEQWEFYLENENVEGHWTGTFKERDGGTEITFTEDLNAKKVLLKPLLKNYMKKQQAQYFEDLKKVLDF